MLRSTSLFSRIVVGFVLCAQLFVLPLSIAAAPTKNDDDMNATKENQTLFAPMAFHYEQRYNVPPTLFGAQLYGDSRETVVYFDDLVDSQTSWVRNELSWSSVQRSDEEPAVYVWTHADKVVGAANHAGLNMVLTLHGAPSWARLYSDSPNGPIHPDYIDDFAQFVAALVERYDGDGDHDMPGSPVVNHIEFYNEGDRRTEAGSRGGWGDAPTAYADMLKAIHPAAHAANPDVQILFSGIAYDWFERNNGPFVESFLDGVLAADGGRYFDIMNFHAYPSFAYNWTDQGPGVYEKTQAVIAKLQEYGLQKPVMITEAGWHSNADPDVPSSPEQQAQYVVQMFAESAAANVRTMIWFSMVDGPDWFPTRNGLVTVDDPPVRKPAFDAYVVMESKMDGMVSDGVLSDDEAGNAKMQVYRFRHDEEDRKLYIAWLNPIDTGEQSSFQVKTENATTSDIYGNSTIVNDSDDGKNDGSVTISVGAQPVYIDVNN